MDRRRDAKCRGLKMRSRPNHNLATWIGMGVRSGCGERGQHYLLIRSARLPCTDNMAQYVDCHHCEPAKAANRDHKKALAVTVEWLHSPIWCVIVHSESIREDDLVRNSMFMGLRSLASNLRVSLQRAASSCSPEFLLSKVGGTFAVNVCKSTSR